MIDLEKIYLYDIETFKHAFTFSIVRSDGRHKKTFQVTKYLNQIEDIFNCLSYLEENECQMAGFNNLGFDYPIAHRLMETQRRIIKMSGAEIAQHVWELAQKQIDSFKGGQFGNTIKVADVRIPQIDLYKINHFDNHARATSLKMLEFNMLMENIEDLPYPIDAELDEEMIAKLVSYNEHDVEATRKFFHICLPQIEFRAVLTERYGRSFMNHNDGKIGKEYFQMRLTESGVDLYTVDSKGKRHMRQTKRPIIEIKNCLFDYYDFKRPECIAIQNWFKKQKITETKGVFTDLKENELGAVAQYAELEVKRKKFKGIPSEDDKRKFRDEYPMGWIEEEQLKATYTVKNADGTKTKLNKVSYWGCWKIATTLNVVIDGLRIDFGTGGIHASRINVIAKENRYYKIIDKDVSSQYPNVAISNRVYPAHLGEEFCDIYQDVYEQRKSFAKGTPENAMLKLALNSVYGDSNNKYSVFYDPQYTMAITLNGQLSILLLAEKILEVPGLRLVQLNTDGLTAAVPREHEKQYQQICKDWEKQVKLELEESVYSKMFIADVNSYIAVFTNGKIKHKGRYAYQNLEWHKNQSCLVVQKAAEAAMLKGLDIETFIRLHDNKWDFMLRTKVPRSSRLVMRMEDGTDVAQQNICRYYPSKAGGKLIKIMPALAGKEADGERLLSIDAAWNVKTCNNACDFSFDDVDYDYYVAEAKKLLVGVEHVQPVIERNKDEEDD